MDSATLAARHNSEAPQWRLAAKQLRGYVPAPARWALLACITGEAAALIGFLWLLAITLAALVTAPALPAVSTLTLLALLALGRGALLILRDHLATRLGLQITSQLRTTLAHNAMQPAWRLQHGEGAGRLATRLGQEVDLLQPYYGGYLPAFFNALIQPVLILLLVFSQNWLAGVLLLFAAPMIPLFMAIIGMGVAGLAEQQQQQLARLGDHFLDRLRALPLLRLTGATSRSIDSVGAAAEAWRQSAMRVLRVAFLSSAVLEFFASIAIASVAIYVGMALLGFLTWGPAESITAVSALVILLLAPEYFSPLRQLGQHYHDRGAALAAMAGLAPLLESPAPPVEQTTPPAPRWSSAPAVTVTDLTLQPPGCAAPIFSGLSLHAAAGEWLAITGPSGSGKSSLADALLGFSAPASGHIEIGGQALTDMAASELRANTAWLGQQPNLSAASVAANIAPDGSGHDQQQRIADLIEDCALTHVVAALPHGLQTRLGDDGAGLSGGERQRVALARALYRQPRLLILDEPTASLDPASEAAILATLRKLAGHTTLIMFVHSERAAAAADRCLHLPDITQQHATPPAQSASISEGSSDV
ncbi:MAG: thiol reductant ABC exporter subunit CydD [Alcanivorax sp.]|nr:thiol reductant ABC exporter subunit CydD [Alcanivorax sp.]